jgi:putative PIN family toxin of toxin-antitoxin system
MKIVLDTNILLVSFSRKSPFYSIWESLLLGKYTLCVTTDILLEYEEIITNHTNYAVAEMILDAITDLPNLVYVNKYIFRDLIKQDPDDNKFVDCAIACNAKYIVSEDKHFKILKEILFPKVDVLRIYEFQELLK